VVDSANQPIGYAGDYEGEFHFAGRLLHPITILTEGDALQDFAHAHPNGLIVTHPEKLDANDLRYALLVQPFRSSWVVIWPATSLADLRAGRTPVEPAQPTQIYPSNRWRYRTQP
jgi:hypothetical protein